MAEQGLKATVYPELDDSAMAQFVKDFSDQLSSTVSVQVGVPTVGTTSGSSDSSSTTQTSNAPGTESAENTKKNIKEAVKSADDDITDDDTKTQKKSKSITTSLGALATTASSAVSGITGVLNAVMGVGKFLEDSSPPLRNVMTLFEQAFNLIWMPVGTMLAVSLMPVLRSVMTDIAGWMSIAFKLYEEEGMSGLVRGAIELSFNVLMKLISNKDFLDLVGTALWGLFSMTAIGMLLRQILGDEEYWKLLPKMVNWWNENIPPFIEGVQKFFKPISDFFDGLTLDNFFQKWIDMALGMWTNILSKIGEFLLNDVIPLAVDLITSIIPGGSMVKDGISTVASWFGLEMAEGGIVTEPTWRLFGEAGPEAVIPLNQLSSVVNDYNSSSIGGSSSYTGGNNITINISGGNAMEIGTEVQRVLEKTVGKASSKLMWW